AERQAIEQDLRLTEQVPTEVKTTSERQAAAGPIRGEETTLAPLDASGSSTSRSGSLSSGIIASRTALQLGAQPNLEAKVMQQALQSRQSPLSTSVTPQPEQILSNIQTTSQVTSTMPSNTSAPI